MKENQFKPESRRRLRAAALIAVTGFSLSSFGEPQVQFNRDIRPILTENCFHCHGPDPGSRKAGLRLDTKEGFFTPTEKRGPTVVPGNLEKSELWRRIVTKDEDDLMPPPKSHKQPLKSEEVAQIKKWIEQGAPWQPHWSFLKPERPAVPVVKNKKWVRNPIDSFVLAKLESKGLQPAPEADRRTLARRVSLDLTGLPPTPQEVEAFVSDKSSDAYIKFVRKTMSSPHWGEHRGRYWLDAARYGDTHGLHFDNYREMWLYRDWVFNAFNRNERFDEFTLEQMAGDLLPNATREQKIATGFHRCNITTNEGGTIEEENLVGYARDRVETTSWVWLGLTSNCAVCHDHKFDAITMKDFYSMASFFRNTTQTGFDGNVKESNPSMLVPQNPEDDLRWAALPGEITEAKNQIEQRKKDVSPDFAKWTEVTKPEDIDRDLSSNELAAHIPLNEGSGTDFMGNCGGSGPQNSKAPRMCSGRRKENSEPHRVFQEGGYVDLGGLGDFEDGKSFSYGAWVNVPKGFKESAAVLARMDDASSFRGWDLWLQGDKLAAHFVNKWPDNALKVVSKKSNIKQGEWQHLFVTYDGSGKKEGTRLFVNGIEQETDIDTGKQVSGSLRTPTPLLIGKRSGGAHFTGGSVQDVPHLWTCSAFCRGHGPGPHTILEVHTIHRFGQTDQGTDGRVDGLLSRQGPALPGTRCQSGQAGCRARNDPPAESRDPHPGREDGFAADGQRPLPWAV